MKEQEQSNLKLLELKLQKFAAISRGMSRIKVEDDSDEDMQPSEGKLEVLNAHDQTTSNLVSELNDSMFEKLTPDMKEKLEQARKEAIMSRDKQLQNDIRLMETELLRCEREWRSKTEQEKSSILATSKKEEEHLHRRCRQLSEEIADYVVEKEQMYQKLQNAISNEDKATNDVAELKREVQIYKDGLAAHQQRYREKEDQHRISLREIQLQYAPIIRELREKYDELQRGMKYHVDAWQQEMNQLERTHAAELARLDATVRSFAFYSP